MIEERTQTAEYVRMGHPDKLADIIADSIVDACLQEDENSHVACEVMLAHNKCFIAGEVTTKAKVDYIGVAKGIIELIGYDTKGIEFECRIHEQSPDINQAVSKEKQGAGDQGIVYGYATDETENFMPLAHELAHKVCDIIDMGDIEGIKPDGKCLVSVNYLGDKVDWIDTIVVSVQHDEKLSLDQVKKVIKEKVIDYVFKDYDLNKTKILINPSGRFVKGGFEADTGLTGRKLQVDSYGGIAHHGGGAYSGKDASKVDRSGAYLARYIAKNIVAAKLAKRCEVALSYAIGVPEPVNVDVNTFGTGIIFERKIETAVKKVFDLSVSGTIGKLDLLRPVFRQTAMGGHYGQDYLMWELTDKVEELKDATRTRETCQ